MKKLSLYFLSFLLIVGILSCKHRSKDKTPDPSVTETKYVTPDELDQASKNIQLKNEAAVNQMFQTMLANYVTKDELNSVVQELETSQSSLASYVDEINAGLKEQIDHLNKLNDQLQSDVALNKDFIAKNKALIASLESKVKSNTDAVNNMKNNLNNTIESVINNLPQANVDKLVALADRLKKATTPADREKICKEIQGLFEAPDWATKKLTVKQHFFETGHPTYFKVELAKIAYKDGKVVSLTQIWNNDTKKFDPTIYSVFDDFKTIDNKTYFTRAQVASTGNENNNAFNILNGKFEKLFESPIMSSFEERTVSSFYDEEIHHFYDDSKNKYYVKAQDSSGAVQFVAPNGGSYAYYASIYSPVIGLNYLILRVMTKDMVRATPCGTLRYNIYDQSTNTFLENDKKVKDGKSYPVFRNIIRLTVMDTKTGEQNVLETPTCEEVSKTINAAGPSTAFDFILYNKNLSVQSYDSDSEAW